jgi:hypothetical protein
VIAGKNAAPGATFAAIPRLQVEAVLPLPSNPMLASPLPPVPFVPPLPGAPDAPSPPFAVPPLPLPTPPLALPPVPLPPLVVPDEPPLGEPPPDVPPLEAPPVAAPPEELPPVVPMLEASLDASSFPSSLFVSVLHDAARLLTASVAARAFRMLHIMICRVREGGRARNQGSAESTFFRGSENRRPEHSV